ncbi:MAG: TlpA family protein disulfide reductase [Alphaproteobacteria bacterium]|nr:TlpA family protein disulfide reductase [Alphaproteobacteria bacterium]
MYKILRILPVLFLFFGSIAVADAKINLFPQPRYMPSLSFYDDNGNAYKLKEFHSDLLMAVVWSRSCGPCLKDLLHLGRFVQQTRDKGIEVILISPEKEWKNVAEKRAFLKRLGANNMVSFNDRKANFRDGMGISVTPTAILVNKNGEEIGQITGSIQWEDPDVIDYMLKLKKDVSEKLNQGKAADQQN